MQKSIKRLDSALEEESWKLKGVDKLISMTGIGVKSKRVLLSVIGDVKDFSDKRSWHHISETCRE